MKKNNTILTLIAALAALCVLGTGTALASDFSIYGGELGRFLQNTDNRTEGTTVSKLTNMSIYGDGIDEIMTATDHVATRTLVAGLDNMSIYGGTIDAYMLSGLSCPSFDLNFLNRLVFNK